MPRLSLVRHGRPAIDRGAVPHTWQLDPAGLADIETLRDSGRLPAAARWFSSPEPKALGTARRLTRSDITVVHDLREHEREVTHWFDHADGFADTVRRAFDRPDERAVPEWEPLA
jgi:broad specificity phosphatase PhoE